MTETATTAIAIVCESCGRPGDLSVVPFEASDLGQATTFRVCGACSPGA